MTRQELIDACLKEAEHDEKENGFVGGLLRVAVAHLTNQIVYAVWDGNYSSDWIETVYDTLEMAEAHVSQNGHGTVQAHKVLDVLQLKHGRWT